MKQKSLKLKPLSEQVIVITGASSGIGLATAQSAAEQGAKVVLSSRNTDDLKRLVREIKSRGGDATAVTADVSIYDDVVDLRDSALAAYGRIDTWVNNAGASTWGLVWDVPTEQLRQQFETNYWGLHYGCMVAIEAMRESGGMIINLGSEVSERAAILQTTYSATKHAIKGYTEGLRTELEHENIPIGVSLIRPAAIDIPFVEHAGNFLNEGAPALPPPVYHPRVVVEAILGAAVTGKRDVFAGGASKLFSVMNHVAPRVVDLFMENPLAYKPSIAGQKKPHDIVNEGLMKAPEREGEIRGEHNGHVAPRSLWTTMSLHPVASAVAVGGLGLLALSVMRAVAARGAGAGASRGGAAAGASASRRSSSRRAVAGAANAGNRAGSKRGGGRSSSSAKHASAGVSKSTGVGSGASVRAKAATGVSAKGIHAKTEQDESSKDTVVH